MQWWQVLLAFILGAGFIYCLVDMYVTVKETRKEIKGIKAHNVQLQDEIREVREIIEDEPNLDSIDD